MPRKKRILLVTMTIILVTLIIIGVLAYLYLKTDTFMSKETLFIKYFSQNFNAIDILKDNNLLEENLNESKYTSKIKGNIEYTEDIETANENRNNPINNVGIKINSNIDNSNNYSYSDISVGTENEDLYKIEYILEDNVYAIRANGITQFASTKNIKELDGPEQIEKIKEIPSTLNSIVTFTENEKNTLTHNYLNIIQANISKDKYYKQKNTIITVNNQSVQANSYYIKLTLEEYNNLKIKLLEQMMEDEIILSKIDIIEENLKDLYTDYNSQESLRQKLIDKIEEKIETIQNNNIGSEEVKIIVYEKNGETIRTAIENKTDKITFDTIEDKYIKVSKTEINEEKTIEQYIKVEKTNETQQNNTLVEYEKIENNDITKKISLDYNVNTEQSKINKNTKLEISNESYKSIFNIENEIQQVEDFENQITLQRDNVDLDKLTKEQVLAIKEIIKENLQEQEQKISSVVTKEDYKKMFENLNIFKNRSIEIPDEIGVTEIERTRFNSQFEFFVSENLTSENITELIKTVENNFDDMKVLTKNGQIEDLDMEKFKLNSTEGTDYRENISEVLISIKERSTNEIKEKDIKDYIEENKNEKFTVSLEYNPDGLVSFVRIKIQET